MVDRTWAAAMLRKVLAKLETDYLVAGRGELYRALKSHWCGDKQAAPYRALGLRLGRSSATLRSDVRRIRARFSELLKSELRAEVGEAGLKEELQNFRQIFR